MSPGDAPQLVRAALVVLSAGIAVFASHVAFDLARRVRLVEATAGLGWVSAAALVLGTGLWSVHVLGLAAAPPLPYALGHHPGATLAVWLLAAIIALGGLGALSARVPRWSRLLPVAAALGAGLAGAQAAALLALGVRPGIDWSLGPLAGALVVGAGGSMLAFAFALRVRGRRRPVPHRPALGAVVLGLTIVLSQHLLLLATGLASQSHALFADRVPPAVLTGLASIGAVALLLSAWLGAALEARLRASLRHAERELQRQSFRDPLTRLPNRLLFESARRSGAARRQRAGPLRRALRRPRSLRAGQRVVRPPRRRSPAAHRRGPAARPGAAAGSARASRRRPVPRARARQPPGRRAGCAVEPAARRDQPAVPDRRARGGRLGLDRHRLPSR
jgi:NO-binding membrane sensor protein with MHYT domain